jgi:hypothetical protein
MPEGLTLGLLVNEAIGVSERVCEGVRLVVGVIEAVWERVAVSDGVTDVEDVMEDV